jgi:hypothetical protein
VTGKVNDTACHGVFAFVFAPLNPLLLTLSGVRLQSYAQQLNLDQSAPINGPVLIIKHDGTTTKNALWGCAASLLHRTAESRTQTATDSM